jgi:hypothetical protein
MHGLQSLVLVLPIYIEILVVISEGAGYSSGMFRAITGLHTAIGLSLALLDHL